MSKEIIATDKAPGALGPYSQAVKAGGIVYVSGCIGLNPETKKIVDGTVADQARQLLMNMKAVVEAAGSDMSKVVKTTCFLADMSLFAEFNGAYAEFFPVDPPARSCFAVKELPLGALAEVEAIALE